MNEKHKNTILWAGAIGGLAFFAITVVRVVEAVRTGGVANFLQGLTGKK